MMPTDWKPPMRPKTHPLLLTIALTLTSWALSPGSAASTRTQLERPHRVKVVKAPKASGGSEETQAQRDRRLRRECKGRPNAGACLGYAS